MEVVAVQQGNLPEQEPLGALSETATILPTQPGSEAPPCQTPPAASESFGPAASGLCHPRWQPLLAVGLGVAASLGLGLGLLYSYNLQMPFAAWVLAYSGVFVLNLLLLALLWNLYRLRVQEFQGPRTGSYRLVRKLGKGGMGEVYLAQHSLLERPAAVKTLRQDRMRSPSALERFEWEVRAASELTHPNTISIYDFGRTSDGSFYYAMEYLQGMDLQRLVDSHGALPAARAVFILDQILGALSEAHRRGILHRDIKPSNVFLTERGGEFDFVKVLDFGLAQELRAASAAGSDQSTGRASIVGTPLYMAPEVFYGDHKVDSRSDLYSFGALAYFLLAGHPVFASRSTVQILIDQAKTQPVPPQQLGIAISDQLQAVLLRTLAKAPEERYATAEELRVQLRAVPEWGQWTREQAAQWWMLTAPDVRASADRPITRSLDSESTPSLLMAA